MSDEEVKPFISVFENAVSDVNLVDFGYAPGGYLVHCKDCDIRHIADKRAWRCLKCAELAARSDSEDTPRERSGGNINTNLTTLGKEFMR